MVPRPAPSLHRAPSRGRRWPPGRQGRPPAANSRVTTPSTSTATGLGTTDNACVDSTQAPFAPRAFGSAHADQLVGGDVPEPGRRAVRAPDDELADTARAAEPEVGPRILRREVARPRVHLPDEPAAVGQRRRDDGARLEPADLEPVPGRFVVPEELACAAPRA